MVAEKGEGVGNGLEWQAEGECEQEGLVFLSHFAQSSPAFNLLFIWGLYIWLFTTGTDQLKCL